MWGAIVASIGKLGLELLPNGFQHGVGPHEEGASFLKWAA